MSAILIHAIEEYRFQQANTEMSLVWMSNLQACRFVQVYMLPNPQGLWALTRWLTLSWSLASIGRIEVLADASSPRLLSLLAPNFDWASFKSLKASSSLPLASSSSDRVVKIAGSLPERFPLRSAKIPEAYSPTLAQWDWKICTAFSRSQMQK